MNREQLIALLQAIDESGLTVVLATDAEGNDFKAIDEVSIEEDFDDDYWGPTLVIWPV